MKKKYGVLVDLEPYGTSALVDLNAVEACETMEQWSNGKRKWKRIYVIDTEKMSVVSELTASMMEEK